MSICGYRSKWIFDDLRCPSTGKRTAKIMITTNNDDDVLSIRTNRARVTIEPTELGCRSVWCCSVRAARHWYGCIDTRRADTSMRYATRTRQHTPIPTRLYPTRYDRVRETRPPPVITPRVLYTRTRSCDVVLPCIYRAMSRPDATNNRFYLFPDITIQQHRTICIHIIIIIKRCKPRDDAIDETIDWR